MKLLKTSAVVLLLVQTFHLASLQETTASTDSTDSTGRPIDQSWWRQRPVNELPKEDADGDPGIDTDYSGIASGSMATNSEEERNVAGETNKTEPDVTTASPHTFHNGTKKKHKHHKHTDSPTVTDANATNHSVDAKDGNLTATSQNSTGSLDVPPTSAENSKTELANDTGSANVTSAPNPEGPDVNETTTNSSTGEFLPKTSDQNSTVASNATGNGTTNANPEDTTTTNPTELKNTTTTNPTEPKNTTTTNPTESKNTTTTNPTEPKNTTTNPNANPEDTTTKNPNANPEDTTTKTPNIPEETTTTANPNVPEDATSEAPVSPEKSNNTEKNGGGSGSSLERGVASDPNKNTRQGAWGGVLGVGVAVAVVGMVAYVILKKRRQKAFSHRKLVEDFPADPVHRLDNNEPLDLNFGGSAAYYNPGLQGDNIQMSNIPGRP